MARLSSIPLLLLLAAPVAAQTAHPHLSQRDAVKKSIDAGNAAYIEAFSRADAKALAQVYDPQGSRLNDSGVVVRGRKAIIQDVGNFVAQVGPVKVTLDSKEFTRDYYETGCYVDDYDEVLGGKLPTLYHVEDSWTNYDKLAPVIDGRFTRWKQGELPPANLIQSQMKQLEEEYLDTILSVARKLPADPLGAIAIFQQYLAAEPPEPYRKRAVSEIERVKAKYGIER